MEEFYKEAVSLKKNVGAWNIAPLPKKFRKTEGDIMRTDCIYYVDTDPGGAISPFSTKARVSARGIAGPAPLRHLKLLALTCPCNRMRAESAALASSPARWGLRRAVFY